MLCVCVCLLQYPKCVFSFTVHKCKWQYICLLYSIRLHRYLVSVVHRTNQLYGKLYALSGCFVSSICRRRKNTNSVFMCVYLTQCHTCTHRSKCCLIGWCHLLRTYAIVFFGAFTGLYKLLFPIYYKIKK